MEFLVAGFEIIEQEPGLVGIFKAAELPGRICYGSQDKIAEGTAERFCNALMKSNHGAPLEHGTVYLKAPIEYEYINNVDFECNGSALDKYNGNPYSKVSADGEFTYVTTNLRVLFENGWLSDLDEYLCEPTEHHERRYQVRFTIDRFTGEEFLRHRKASFNRESTRYVTFTKEKFGGGSIKFIVPVWMLDKIDRLDRYTKEDVSYFAGTIVESERTGQPLDDVFYWAAALKVTEWSYDKLVNECGWKAQQARTVLPCAINSPLIKTAFISDWIHFFKLRSIGTTGKPHPQAEELATPLMHEFIKRGYMKPIQ